MIWKKKKALAIALLGGMAILPFMAYWLAPALLWVDSRPASVDVIVIAGGNGPQRVPIALRCFREALGKEFLVTGEKEWQGNLDLLEQGGIKPNLVLAEKFSRSTAENASMGVKILREKKIKKALIVTSWYHSRRALSCFQHYAPEIEFSTQSIPSNVTEPEKVKVVLMEYLKIFIYSFKYGILPFPKHPPTERTK